MIPTILQQVYGARHQVHVEQLHAAIDEQAKRTLVRPDPVEWVALLILRAPVAARAQHAMDKHPHTPDQQARLFELIDFNDTFVSTAIALNQTERVGFVEALRPVLDRFCKQVGAHHFSDEQYDAITRGLTREVAVYLGALAQGFDATLTSRSQDALGVDMIITDPLTGRRINIDCKTPSAFRYRLQDLVREGRLSEAEAELADQTGYAHERNGHGREAVAVTILRIDPNEMGDIRDFVFTQPELLGVRLRAVLQAETES